MASTSHKRAGSPLPRAVERRISPPNQHQVSASSNYIPSVLNLTTTGTHFSDPTSTSGAGPSSPRFDLTFPSTLDSREYEVETALRLSTKEYIVASSSRQLEGGSGETPTNFLTSTMSGGGGGVGGEGDMGNGMGRSSMEGKKRRKDGKVVEPRTSRACLNCRKQKMRCEGADEPPCKRCRTSSTDCVFERRSDYILNPQDSAWQQRIEAQITSLSYTVQQILDSLARSGRPVFPSSSSSDPLNPPHHSQSHSIQNLSLPNPTSTANLIPNQALLTANFTLPQTSSNAPLPPPLPPSLNLNPHNLNLLSLPIPIPNPLLPTNPNPNPNPNPTILKNTLEASLVALERSVVLVAEEVEGRQVGGHADPTEGGGEPEAENGTAFFL